MTYSLVKPETIKELILGWRVCPDELVARSECKSPTGIWTSYSNATIHLQVSSLNMTTAYSLFNSSIVYIDPTTSLQPVMIPSSAIFSVLENMWIVPDLTSLQAQMLLMLAQLLRSGDLEGRGAWTDSDLLRSFLAFMLNFLSDPVPDTVQLRGYFAKQTYRIILSSYCRYLFVLLSVVTLIWCGVLLIYCWMAGPGPNLSLFPEFDFAAKVISDSLGGFRCLLSGQGNTTSAGIKRSINGQSMFIGSVPTEEGVNRVVIDTKPIFNGLNERGLYL